MFLEAFQALRRVVDDWLRRNRTRDDYPDGSSLSEIHRFGIRYTSSNGSFVDIGYEATNEFGSPLWLIHEESFRQWDSPVNVPVSEEDRRKIVASLVDYCEARGRPSKFVA
jgi:hypothetical protein